MDWPLKIQGRYLSDVDVEAIRVLLLENPDWSRWRLSFELCRLWGWCRPDGQLKDMACREMLNKLESRGLVSLPERRSRGFSGRVGLRRVELDQSPVAGFFGDIKPVEVFDARRSRADEDAFNYLMGEFHYLGFSMPVGQNMKYLFRGTDGRLLGAALFGAAAWKCAARDLWIGWEAGERERNLNLLCNNTRFLIPPWVRVPHLASHVLGACLRRLASDWERRYGTSPVLVETFVDGSRFKGVCYKAANWLRVGSTSGRGRQDRHHRSRVPVKDIWLYPLRPDFRKILSS